MSFKNGDKVIVSDLVSQGDRVACRIKGIASINIECGRPITYIVEPLDSRVGDWDCYVVTVGSMNPV